MKFWTSSIDGLHLPYEPDGGSAACRQRRKLRALERVDSPPVLLMNKRHQRDEMGETARKASPPASASTSISSSIPGETEADWLLTFRTMSDIGRQFNNVRFAEY